ncbi:MAG TPA: hypothetical protein VLJ58_00640 [Ramlibacter sp.]|nr:hypothetical protein [Ramlibacter sp.]
MALKTLEDAVRNHTGEFICQRIHGKKRKTVDFKHTITPPDGVEGVPDIGKLQQFYKTFGSILFYHDEMSGDAAKYLAPVAQWTELHELFSDWIEDLDEDEREEILPEWIESCLVIGETPHSGNYILMPTEGAAGGRVFEFDHDGFEFTEEAKDVVDYTKKLLKPDGSRLTEMASHMRFVEGDPTVQWWIRELRDNNGHAAITET